MPLDDPYAPPASDLATPVLPGRRRRIFWVVGFLANLVVPALFAAAVLTPRGWIGLLAASLALLVLGLTILAGRPSWTRPATVGAFAMAATQLFPVLQVGVGMVAVAVSSEATGSTFPLDDDAGPETRFGPVPAFLATTLGGLSLMGLSLIAGLVIEPIRGRGSDRPQPAHVVEFR